MSLKSKLVKAFAAVALFTTALGFLPSTAQAMTPAVSMAPSIAAMNAANAAAAAAHARHVREATNDVIVNPTPQNIENAKGYDVVDNTTIPYLNSAIADLNLKPGTKADDITDAQRDRFTQLLQDKKLIAEMSSDTPEAAVAKGMSSGLSPYFNQVKSDLGYSGTVNLAQAQAMQQRMASIHWEHDTKPVVEKTALVVGGVALVGGAAYVIGKKNRGYDY